MTDSRELVARFQAGDADAFTELYSRHRADVFMYAYRLTHRADVADDITQDVFVKALTRLGTWQDRGQTPLAWLMTVTRNTAISRERLRMPRITTSVAEYHRDIDPTADDRDSNPEQAVIARLCGDAVLAAVWRLTPDQRECVGLRYIQGLSIAETAQAMGRPEHAIKALTYRATRQLAVLLEGEGWR